MERLPVCELRDIEIRYGPGAFALGPVSLRVFSGEILGLRGANGAGKSTLLQALAGIRRPDRGSCIYGEDVQNRISYVPQDVALYESLSGRDNLKFWGGVYGLPGKVIKARSRWLLEELDLVQKADEWACAYSGGMRRRLHLATGLMVTPKLLIADEPTAGADAQSTELIFSLLKHMRELGCGVVLTTHQQGELEQVSDRVLNLEAGRLVPEGLGR